MCHDTFNAKHEGGSEVYNENDEGKRRQKVNENYQFTQNPMKASRPTTQRSGQNFWNLNRLPLYACPQGAHWNIRFFFGFLCCNFSEIQSNSAHHRNLGNVSVMSEQIKCGYLTVSLQICYVAYQRELTSYH